MATVDDPFGTSGANDDPFRPDGALDASAKKGAAGDDDEGFGAMAAEGSVDGASVRSGSVPGNPLSRPTSAKHSASAANSQGGPGSRRDSDAIGQHRESGIGGSMRRESTANGTMRRGGFGRTSTFARTGTMREGGGAAGGLAKKATMASMMLSGGDPTEIVATGPDDDGVDYAFGEEGASQDGGDGGFATADRMEAEQIFMPNLKREAYIPVRIARDKVKMVLSQMAQLKTMHYQALETMEKQHEFLKAQLEASVATYVRKLTKDYNDRVNALESEYRRRLQNLNADALTGLKTTLQKSKEEAAGAGAAADERIREKEAELASERKLFQARIEQEKKLSQAAHEEAARAKIALEQAQREVEELRAQLGTLPQDLATATQQIADLTRENDNLRDELRALTED